MLRLFPALVRARPPATLEEFPRLTRARVQEQEEHIGGHPTEDQGTRPRSRSPRETAWKGLTGKHMEATQVAPQTFLERLRQSQAQLAHAKAQPKAQARKRQGEASQEQEVTSAGGKAKRVKNQRNPALEVKLTPKEVAEHHKKAYQAGFTQVFSRRSQGALEEAPENLSLIHI